MAINIRASSEEARPKSPPASDTLNSATRENIDVLAQYHEQELAEVSPLQAAIESLSDFFGSPVYLVCALIFIVVWVTINLWGVHSGWRHVDEPPFFGFKA